MEERPLSPEQGTNVNTQPGSAAAAARFCRPPPKGVKPVQLAEQLQVHSDGGTAGTTP